MKHRNHLVLAAALCAGLAGAGAAQADPQGNVVGTVAGLTGASIDVKANRQIVHILLQSPFSAVYLADRQTRAQLTDITMGMPVRVWYTQSTAGAELRTGREIDILANP